MQVASYIESFNFNPKVLTRSVLRNPVVAAGAVAAVAGVGFMCLVIGKAAKAAKQAKFGSFDNLKDREQEALHAMAGGEKSWLVLNFLSAIIADDSDFNARAKNILAYNKELTEEFRKALNFAFSFSHKASAKQLNSLRDDLKDALDAVPAYDGQAVDKKLPLSQIKKIESLAKLHSYFDGVDLAQHKTLQEVADLAKQASAWKAAFAEKLKQDPNYANWTATGNILAYTLDGDRYNQGKVHSTASRVFHEKWLGSDASHLAINVANDKWAQQAHMWGRPSVYNGPTALGLGTFANDSYCFNWAEYLSDEAKEKLGGENAYLTKVQELYDAKIKEVLKQKKGILTTLRNPAGPRFLQALNFNTRSLFRRLTWRQQGDFQGDWLKNAKTVSCSEFVIRVSLTAMAALEKQLKGDGYAVKKPFKREPQSGLRLWRYSPAYAIYRGVNKANMLTRVERPQVFDHLIDSKK